MGSNTNRTSACVAKPPLVVGPQGNITAIEKNMTQAAKKKTKNKSEPISSSKNDKVFLDNMLLFEKYPLSER